jgi:hypothetical protein
MTNIRLAAIVWLRRQIRYPKSALSLFLIKQSINDRNFSPCNRHIVSSKYFRAEEAFPRVPVWWLGIPLDWISGSNGPCPFAFLICQKQPNNELYFCCLPVPFECLNSEYRKGNLGILGNDICLHLSTENCKYRLNAEKTFDDVRLTMLTGYRPTPFAQFLI